MKNVWVIFERTGYEGAEVLSVWSTGAGCDQEIKRLNSLRTPTHEREHGKRIEYFNTQYTKERRVLDKQIS